tara:strand:+ start:550 stop:1044 length:495 start_codon:yes stop_codon:yes gene_type:complete
MNPYHYDWEEQCDIDFRPELSPTITPEDLGVKEAAAWYEEKESLESWIGFYDKQHAAFCLYETEIATKVEMLGPEQINPAILGVYEEKLGWIIEYREKIEGILLDLNQRLKEVKVETDKWDNFWVFWEKMETLFDFISGRGFGLKVKETNEEGRLTQVYKKRQA